MHLGITVRDGSARDTVARAVKDAMRLFLWPLAPGGPTCEGWPLGRRLREAEMDAAVARVAGVDTVTGCNIFVKAQNEWMLLPQPLSGVAELNLEQWQLPELLGVVVGTDGDIPESLSGLPNPFAANQSIAVPVVPEVC